MTAATHGQNMGVFAHTFPYVFLAWGPSLPPIWMASKYNCVLTFICVKLSHCLHQSVLKPNKHAALSVVTQLSPIPPQAKVPNSLRR